MPVGELVATIDCNDSQALSDDNIDELRSACHDAAVMLDGKIHQFFLAIRRIWVNDWAWPSRRYRLLTTSAPQLIRTTRRVECFTDGSETFPMVSGRVRELLLATKSSQIGCSTRA